MTQIRIFEIDDDESDEDEYYTKRPKYANIIQEEDYEDDDEEREESSMTLDEITSENLPSADELEAELQEFLRKQRDDG